MTDSAGPGGPDVKTNRVDNRGDAAAVGERGEPLIKRGVTARRVCACLCVSQCVCVCARGVGKAQRSPTQSKQQLSVPVGPDRGSVGARSFTGHKAGTSPAIAAAPPAASVRESRRQSDDPPRRNLPDRRLSHAARASRQIRASSRQPCAAADRRRHAR